MITDAFGIALVAVVTGIASIPTITIIDIHKCSITIPNLIFDGEMGTPLKI